MSAQPLTQGTSMRPTGHSWRSHATYGQQNKPDTTDQFNPPFDTQFTTDLLAGDLAIRDLLYGDDDMLE